MQEYNDLLYGTDNEERLVGIHLHDGESVMLYSRDDRDRVTSRIERFYPFAFFTDEGMEILRDNATGWKEYVLAGNGDYRNLVIFKDWSAHWDGVKAVRDEDRNEVQYIPSPEDQYLMQTGKTLYKGMDTSDVKRMQLDIEVYSSTGAFPLAERPGDEIFIVSMSDNRGWEKILRLVNDKASPRDDEEVFLTEEDLLRGLRREIHRQDPDIIELHNGFGFDLDYITARFGMYNMEFSIGRNRQEPRTWKSQKKFAERDVTYTNHLVAGRSVVDTMFYAMAFDVFTRALPNYRLKDVADYLREGEGVTYEEMYGRARSYVQGDKITELWDTAPDGLLDYALDDVRETAYLSEKFAGATFFLSQMLPLTYQETHLAGSGRIIQSIMIREYMRERQSFPKPETGAQTTGGYTDIFYTGRFEQMVYADVASLYPSIMLRYHCHPESDVLGVHRSMLSQLTDLRLSVKADAKAAKETGDKAKAGTLKAMEQSYKIIINSCYGVMGDQFSLFNDFSEADRVTQTGQQLLKRMIDLIERVFKGKVIECDTDGVLYQADPAIWDDLDAQKQQVYDLSEMMPEGINIDLEGLFDVMISYRKKNYALRDYDGKIKTKGGAFKNRGIEQFGREYQAEMLDALFEGHVQRMYEIHDRWKKRIVNSDWSIEDFQSRASLKESMDAYDEKVDDGSNQQAQYEIAKLLAERTGRDALKGDTIYYFVAGSDKAYKVRSYADAMPSEDWKPGMENTRYYLNKRLKSFASRFEIFFEKQDFARIFSMNADFSRTASLFDLPVPDFSGTQIVSKKVK